MRLLVAFLVAGVLEVSVLVLVGQLIGSAATIGLLLLNVVVGIWLLRREGRKTVREATEAARLRRPPERGLGDGVLIAAGGILIILPGFISDLAGVLCLLPLTRSPLRRRLQRAAERRSQSVQDSMRARAQRAYREGDGRPAGEDVIDGEVVSVDEEDEPARGPSEQLPPRSSPQAEPPSEGRRR